MLPATEYLISERFKFILATITVDREDYDMKVSKKSFWHMGSREYM